MSEKKGFQMVIVQSGDVFVEERTIYYIDPKGKDACFDRWRAYLYYTLGYAETLLFGSEGEYRAFLERHKNDTYSTYEEFLKGTHESMKASPSTPEEADASYNYPTARWANE